MYYKHTSRTIAAVLFTALVIFDTPVHSGGFAVPEASMLGLGMSNAVVANPEETGAFAYNPAAMVFHASSSVSVAAMAIAPSLSVRNSAGKHDGNTKNIVVIPLFNANLRFADKWAAGLNVGTPFGLETDWSPRTFPALSNFPASLSSPTKSNLELIAVTPTIAYRVNDHIALSVGADYYNAFGIDLNTTEADIKASAHGYGWNAALMAKTERFSIGISYHSSATLNADGKFQTPYVASGIPIPAEADIDLPWRLQAGIRIKATDTFAVEFDYNRTGWSSFDEIVVKADAIVPPGTVLTRSVNNWQDSNTYRVGASWQVTGTTQLRFGYSFDQTPQKKSYFSARIPDAHRQLFSIGLGQVLDAGWELEASYMYVLFDDNRYRANTAYPNPAAPADPNGTNAFNGKYESDVHLFGIGISKTFM